MYNSFDSIDKLVEFGMSIAVAQQMVNTMNSCINNMAVPGVQNNLAQPKSQYFVAIDGAQSGPYEDAELAELVKQGKVDAKSLIWKTGLTAWTFAEKLPEVNKLFLLYPKK